DTVRYTAAVPDIDVKELESNLIEAARSWEDNFERILSSTFGEAKANELNKKYANAFPRAYKEEVLPSVAIADIAQLEKLDDEHKLGMLFYRSRERSEERRV